MKRKSMDSAEEHLLVQRAQAGDEAACSELLSRQQPRMEAWIGGLVVRESDRLDVLQEALIDAWKGLPNFDATLPLGPWLKVICRNRVAKYFRDRSRNSPPTQVIVEESLLEASNDDWDHCQERVEALRHCLESLGSERRALIESRAAGTSVQELAKKAGKSPNTLSMILLRSKAALLDCVKKRLGAVYE